MFGSNLRTLRCAVLTYASVSATSIGISQNFSYYFISFINASSLLGRFAAGSISDRFGENVFIDFYGIDLIDKLGSLNVMIPFTALAGIMTYAWPFAQTEASLIVVTVLYGFVFFIKISFIF